MKSISSILNYGKAFFNYQLRRKVCSHWPLQVWIEPTSCCNLRCVMCPNPKLKPSQKGYMPLERFKKIVDAITPYVNSVSICHRGEPLLHKGLCEMIEYASSRGIKTGIATNGTLLNEELSQRLIKSGLSRISFSFDGYDKETYEKIRVGAKFEVVLNNILQFLKIKRDMNSRTPHVTLQVINVENLEKRTSTEDKKEFIKHFEGLPLDRLYFKNPHNWGGSMENIGSCKTNRIKVKQKHICNSPWYSLVFHWDGAIYPCTMDYLDNYPLGNIDQDRWMDIWNGERMMQMRSELASGKLNECQHCAKCYKFYEKKFMGISIENLFNEDLFRIKWNLFGFSKNKNKRFHIDKNKK